MKFYVFILVTLLLVVAPANAATYNINDGYFTSLTLVNHETLLMTGGGGHNLTLDDSSQATIQGTAPLVEHQGGIWDLRVTGNENCFLDFSGGGIHEFYIAFDAHAKFSGGRIDKIFSWQHVTDVPVGDPPVWVPDKHIEIVCWDWNWQESTNILTGTWEDYSTFNIQLYDIVNYDPVIDNIKFTIIPEPVTLLLLSVGGLVLRRKR